MPASAERWGYQEQVSVLVHGHRIVSITIELTEAPGRGLLVMVDAVNLELETSSNVHKFLICICQTKGWDKLSYAQWYCRSACSTGSSEFCTSSLVFSVSVKFSSSPTDPSQINKHLPHSM